MFSGFRRKANDELGPFAGAFRNCPQNVRVLDQPKLGGSFAFLDFFRLDAAARQSATAALKTAISAGSASFHGFEHLLRRLHVNHANAAIGSGSDPGPATSVTRAPRRAAAAAIA